MPDGHLLCFGPYQLDAKKEQFWCEGQLARLPPKVFQVLRYLVERPGQLVTKEELFRVIWVDTVVGDAAPTMCIQELRKALQDNAREPQYIETVHRRGFRFIGKVVSGQWSVVGSCSAPEVKNPQSPIRIPQSAIPLVGRDAELAQLHQYLDKALSGERQLVFVTGEPGIGKTALVDAFLQSLESENQTLLLAQVRTLDARRQTLDASLWLTRGQCIEHFGAGEPYLPLLAALRELGQEPDKQQLVTILHQHAPTWLLQLPALLSNLDLGLLRHKTAGATRERMSRELTEALEVLTTEHPVALVLEDLHWSDLSTLEFMSYLARRRHECRLFVIGTYRPVEMLSDGHPLKRVTQELFAHSLGKESKLTELNEVEVTTYLTRRFPESVLSTRLGQVLYQRTGGNPLFLTSMVQDLPSQHVLLAGVDGRWEFHGTVEELETRTPATARQVLARQRERLAAEDQRMLEAASLAGLEFSTATVAAALEAEVTQVETQCGRLAEQQQFLRSAGISEWPDGTRAARYGFLHALYQEFWHERVQVGQQQQWHLRMGERQEAAYGQRAREIAAELALHFAEGRDYHRAVRYLQQAAETAMQRSAYQEAIAHLTKGLALLKHLPDTRERTQQELGLQITLVVRPGSFEG